MNLPETLYHGTSDGYLDAILRDGLRPESSGTGYLCYADDHAVALHHAAHMAEWDESMLVWGHFENDSAIPLILLDLAF